MPTPKIVATKLAELAPSTRREGNHVTILVGNAPLSPNFVPSYLSKDSGLPVIPAGDTAGQPENE